MKRSVIVTWQDDRPGEPGLAFGAPSAAPSFLESQTRETVEEDAVQIASIRGRHVCLWLACPVGLQAQRGPASDTTSVAVSRNLAALHFNRLSIRDGLSQIDVYALLQDRQGFMWLGTRYGLDRYERHTFSIYRNLPVDVSSLSENWILALFEDRAGAIWVGTARGLNRLDAVTGCAFGLNDPDDGHSLSHGHIQAIYEVLWFSSGETVRIRIRQAPGWKAAVEKQQSML